ncbi:MAG: hypothetical protein ABSC05_26380 [Candidatus Solibacter sp.]|jgi:hypothetical protein
MTQLYPLEVWLPEEEIDALDQACEIFGLCTADSHSQFIRRCLLYGLLSLRDAGVLEFPDTDTPVFVRQHDQIEGRLVAAADPMTPAPPEPPDAGEAPPVFVLR